MIIYRLQITYQLKILTTAFFASIILRRTFSRIQWISLIVLAGGVSLAQVDQLTLKDSTNVTKKSDSHDDKLSNIQEHYFVGLVAVLTVCFTSAFAGIYFEKIMKSDPQTSIWMQNIRFSIFGAPISYLLSWAINFDDISAKGYFNAYDFVVWIIVLGSGIGGLMVTLCIRYADNILKSYSQSCAVILSCAASIFFFQFRPTAMFLIGALMICISIYLYAQFPLNSIDLSKLPIYRNQASIANGNIK